MKYFLVLAEEGSISAAAQRLFVTQQAFSEQMKRLETACGAVQGRYTCPLRRRSNAISSLHRSCSLPQTSSHCFYGIVSIWSMQTLHTCPAVSLAQKSLCARPCRSLGAGFPDRPALKITEGRQQPPLCRVHLGIVSQQMMVPALPFRASTDLSGVVMMHRRPGRASTKRMAASTLGSMEPAANWP